LVFAALSVAACDAEPAPLTVYLTPNTHGTVSGWLVDFDTERSHVVNNYSSHMDRVAADPNYAMAFSEVPNLMVLLQFAPERVQQLKAQMQEGRLELVNGFFLEPTINLSGGEALVQMGVLGLRWYDEMFGRRPRFAWMIDVCGAHRQMPQIVSGLGLEAIFFGRNNPVDKSAFSWIAPDGSRTLAICIGRNYASAVDLFKSERALAQPQMDRLFGGIGEELAVSPSRFSLFMAVGGGDYSLAPKNHSYPTALLEEWRQQHPAVRLRFAVPGEYVNALQQEIRESRTTLPEFQGDMLNAYNAFWMNMPEIKLRYRLAEHLLQASELLATAESMRSGARYPSEPLYHSWIQMLMNMDRNILWGAGAGEPFYSSQHWNAQDRFTFVEQHAGAILQDSLRSLTTEGRAVALFNPLNWARHDPIALVIPAGMRPAGVPCESHGEQVLCVPSQPSAGLTSITLEPGQAPVAVARPFQKTITTAFYTLTLDEQTGAILSLHEIASGREYVGGPANVVLAESVAGIEKDPANWMPPRPRRKIVDSSSNHIPTWTVWQGPLTTTLVASSGFIGTSSLERRIILYGNSPRIDFETTVDLCQPDVVVTVDFPLPGTVEQRTRGIPYGFTSTDPRQVAVPIDYFLQPDQKLYGSPAALAPCVRWSDYGFAGGGGLALLDRGLPSHEYNGHTVTLALLNAQSTYRGRSNTILTGQGRRTFVYALWPHDGTWQQARIPQRAWEFNTPVFAQTGRSVAQDVSFLKTSPNLIVEAMRRVGPDIEVRCVESDGLAGEAEITLNLPHLNARLTDLMGEHGQFLPEHVDSYRFPVRPQQIVTLRFATTSAAPVAPAIRSWDALVPPEKLPALHQHANLLGYPGGEPK
jgi:alpha-mannosidase